MVRLGWILVAAVVFTVPVLAPAAQPSAGMTYTLAPDGELTLLDQAVDPMAGTATVVSTGAEPHILVDKLGRSILIGDHQGVSMSLDGGNSWFDNTPNYINSQFIADGWALAQDGAGTIYASTTNGAVINVASSTNGGLSWQLLPGTFVVDAGAIADRPWMAARNTGQVAMIWNEGGLWERCSYSTNAGLTWTRTPPLPVTTNGIPIGGIPAFDKSGRLVFAGDGGIGGGAATLFRSPTSSPCSGVWEQLALPAIGPQLSTHVVANSAGIYLAGPTADNSAIRIIGYPGFSTTGMKELTVSPPSLKANTFATIAVRDNGELSVTWYGTTASGNFQSGSFQGQWNVSNARVKNFWSATPTVVYTQVTSQSHHIGSICMLGTNCDIQGGDRDLLDYFATTYDAAGNLHVAYAADGAGDFSATRTYYAKLAALP